MQLFLMGLGAIGVIVGSLSAAALLYWILWRAFELVRHPEWTSLLVVAVIVLALFGKLPRNQFTDMAMAFAGVAALPLWLAGRSWHSARGSPRSGKCCRDVELEPIPVWPDLRAREACGRMYPAITACICEDRAPTRRELHLVASRLWREGLSRRLEPHGGSASFGARRALLRAAAAALVGERRDNRSRPAL